MHLAIMVGKFVKQDVREWYPSTTGPLLPTMIDGLGILCLGGGGGGLSAVCGQCDYLGVWPYWKPIFCDTLGIVVV